MSTPAEIIDEVHDHLAGHHLLAGVVRVTDLDLSPSDLDPPAAVVGPPTLTPTTTASGAGGGVGVARYRLTVYVVVAQTDRAFREAVDYASLVVRVLDEPGGIIIVEWRPTTFPAGSTELPAYAIDLEIIT